MKITLLVLIIAASAVAADENCPMHAKHAQVDQRGDRVMGFSHTKTQHNFRLHRDGGAIEVRANDATDQESIDSIRAHMKEIAKEFAAGEFSKPEEIHARKPDGVEVMRELGDAIRYEYREIERGALVRVTTRDARGIDAVHRFMKFQIEDHRTGDTGKVE
jgi:hypothetical protein